MEFRTFNKIARLSRDIVVTEKIDGTNGVIGIETYGRDLNECYTHWPVTYAKEVDGGTLCVFAGSRNKWVTPGKSTDNHGFAAWVREHAEELITLGDGYHYGEWWGQGIQRTYGLKEKRFSLFNVAKWRNANVRPACCGVVPVLYEGAFDMHEVFVCIKSLEEVGSFAAPGYMKPEGIVIFHTASGTLFKKTIENDEKPKGAQNGLS